MFGKDKNSLSRKNIVAEGFEFQKKDMFTGKPIYVKDKYTLPGNKIRADKYLYHPDTKELVYTPINASFTGIKDMTQFREILDKLESIDKSIQYLE